MSIQANYYWVRLEGADAIASSEHQTLLCTCRARLKKVGQQVMVGDRVWVEEPDWSDRRGVIAAICPRRSQLDRPPVANVNQILLIFALREPQLDSHQLTRFLVKAELTGLAVQLCLNKCDLASAEDQQAWSSRLQGWGYRPLLISVQRRIHLDVLAQALQNRTTVVSGPSGVGKSSLINCLVPDAQLRVKAVSGKLGRGRHTTRHVQLLELPQGGVLVDTPGSNQPDVHCQPEVLGRCFPEIRTVLQQGQCQFADCLHRDEPGCVVPKGWERYSDYLEMLAACVAQQQALNDSTDPEDTFKTKIRQAGQVHREPRLEAKKYRRVSRRHRRQALQDLRYELTGDLNDLEAFEDND